MTVAVGEAHDCASEGIRGMTAKQRVRSCETKSREMQRYVLCIPSRVVRGDANVVHFPDSVHNVWIVSLLPPSSPLTHGLLCRRLIYVASVFIYLFILSILLQCKSILFTLNRIFPVISDRQQEDRPAPPILL